MEPTVSITVAIYNVEDYLEQCLTSIKNQTYKALEVILIDDGSTDCSGEICDRFADVDKRFIVIHKQNEGAVKARKDGVKTASGKYIYIMDGDDWLDSEWISDLVKAFTNEIVDVVVGRYALSFPDKEQELQLSLEPGIYKTIYLQRANPGMLFNIEKFSFGTINPSVWNKMFIREKVLPFFDILPDKLTMGEDFAFVMPYMVRTSYISIVNTKSVYHYRQRDNSMVRKYNPKLKENIGNLIMYLDSIDTWSEYEREQLKYYYLKLIIYVYYNQLKDTSSFINRYRAVSHIYHIPQFDRIIREVNRRQLPIKQYLLSFCFAHKWTLLLAALKR